MINCDSGIGGLDVEVFEMEEKENMNEDEQEEAVQSTSTSQVVNQVMANIAEAQRRPKKNYDAKFSTPNVSALNRFPNHSLKLCT
jgi:hypothetical protein